VVENPAAIAIDRQTTLYTALLVIKSYINLVIVCTDRSGQNHSAQTHLLDVDEIWDCYNNSYGVLMIWKVSWLRDAAATCVCT
jgi:hypothetical protein